MLECTTCQWGMAVTSALSEQQDRINCGKIKQPKDAVEIHQRCLPHVFLDRNVVSAFRDENMQRRKIDRTEKLRTVLEERGFRHMGSISNNRNEKGPPESYF